ncbi:MAG: arginase family protein [Bacteriovoracales bacterium]|nr:arginase family protein [Bacteriovoracales bacterium]
MSLLKDVEKQLAQRKGQSLLSKQGQDPSQGQNGETIRFLTAESDWGVARNGGRRGARFAPKAIVHCLGKMVSHTPLLWEAHPVSNALLEPIDFNGAQKESTQMIASLLKLKESPTPLFHLGGGHDHIYPLLKALEKSGSKRVVVVNIDAHCDTRPDPLPHSGTPFRQFDEETSLDFDLIQLGIHSYTNTKATLAPLKRGRMTVFGVEELPRKASSMRAFLNETVPIHPDAHYIVSLDCDGLSSSIMEAVSAVNHNGLEFEQVSAIFNWARKRLAAEKLIYGIYEYNPIYDNLSQKGARALAALIYESAFKPMDMD